MTPARSGRPSRLAATLALLGAASIAAGLLVSSARARASAPVLTGDVNELRVPHAGGSIVLDGDLDDPGWLRDIARTGPFVGLTGEPVRVYSDARFVYGDGVLYVGLYAADEDIRAQLQGLDAPVWTEDSFHLVFDDGVTARSFDVSAIGTLADGRRRAGAAGPSGERPFDFAWNSGAHVSHEMDGTPNAPTDHDEEWLLEMAIPLDALGLTGAKGERIGVALRRCDTPRSGARFCGSWGTGGRRQVLVLD